MTGTRRMHKRIFPLLVAVICAPAVGAPPAPAQEAAPVCAQKAPTQLKFRRQAGKHHGRLSWHAGRAARGRFRVFRNGATVGQTRARSMRVSVRPGRQYLFSVRPVNAAGAVSNCEGQLTQSLRWYPPFRVRHVSVKRVRKLRATLSWARVRRGDGRLAGYRVYRDGVVYRQVKPRRRSVRVNVTPGTHLFRVIAADTRGAMGQASRSVRVRVRHTAPTAPGRLRVGTVSDTTVELGWGQSRRRSSPITGYRIFRNGVPIGQTRGLNMTVANLAPATGYRFSVAAVDRWGYLSRSTAAQAATAMPPPTLGNLHAFLLATTDESFRDLQRHYRQIGTVYPTYFDCYGPGGATRGANDPLVTQWAQLRQIAVLPRYDCQSSTRLHQILTDPATRSARIAELVNLVRTQAYDGINLDFEAGFAEDRDALTSFVATLSQQLHAIGKRVSVDVSAKWQNTTTGRSGFYDYAALGTYADTVFVMNWGWHWTTSSPGPPDELTNVTKVADYVSTMPNRSRFVLGAPLYAQDWPNGGGSSNPSSPKEYGDVLNLIARYGGTPVLDPASNVWHYTYSDEGGNWHDVWYGDASTIGTRIQLAKTRGLGIGFWRLGLEHQRVWDDPLIAPGAVWP